MNPIRVRWDADYLSLQTKAIIGLLLKLSYTGKNLIAVD